MDMDVDADAFSFLVRSLILAALTTRAPCGQRPYLNPDQSTTVP